MSKDLYNFKPEMIVIFLEGSVKQKTTDEQPLVTAVPRVIVIKTGRVLSMPPTIDV